jgi:hypothetical protein
MKTKLTLTIIGVIQVFQSILYSAFAESSIDMMFNVGEESGKLAVMFQYAITPAFLMIGLMFLFLRNLAVEDAKNYYWPLSLLTYPCLAAFIIWPALH